MKIRMVIPIVLCILIALSSITVLSCLATSNSEINLISKRLPEIYGSSNMDSFELNGTKVRFASTGVANMEKGYDLTNTETKSFWSEKVIAFTDGDTQKGQYIRPQNSGDDDRIIIVYRFASSNVSRLTFNLSGTRKKNISVYLSSEYNTLFSGNSAYEIVGDRSKEFEKVFDSAVLCTYMGIVIEDADYDINEIELFGTIEDKGENIITDMTPTMYASAESDKFVYNWSQIHYGTGANEMKHGYSEKDVTGFDVFWNDYTKKITDNNINTSLYIKPEVKNNHDRIIIVYSFSDLYDVNAFRFSFGAGIKNFSVYLSKDRNELFSGDAVANVVRFDGENYSDQFDVVRVKYIGIVLDKPDYEVFDISFYGDVFNPPPKGENIIKNTTPITYASSNSNANEFNWSQTYYSETEMKHGYDYKGNGFRDFWQEHVSKLTDENEETELYIKAERTWSNDNVLMIYNIDDSTVNGFSLKTSSTKRKVVKVYASRNITNLFDSCILSIDTYDNNLMDDGTLDIRAKYVAIVLVNPAYSVSEIEINAIPYQRPDYGTNLLEGKRPQRLFLANREYPLIPNGDEIIDIWGTNSCLYKATDGDFKTYVNWAPTKAKSRVTKDTRYMVLSYDLGDTCILDKVLVEGSLAGFDLYVSNDFNDLFETFDNRVYTSDGDKLKSDGTDLDPATDLTSDEILIDLDDVTGRYIGMVITRAQAVGVTSYEIANITEFQVFGTKRGTEYGKNILKEKTPIMCYRAKNSDYSSAVGQMTSPQDMKRYTDDDLDSGAEIQFPNVGGNINYDYGSLVMIYYLEGNSKINYFSASSCFYYGIGGIDVYAAGAFADLFKEENLKFTTNGADAEDGIYNPQSNLGSRGISAYFDTPATGRYVAFVFTRIHDSNAKGWGIFRLSDLELRGEKLENEVLPNTTLTDSSTGSTATFVYDNPDMKFEFADKGITGFKIRYLKKDEYLTETFKYSLNFGGYNSVSDAFVLEFYNKDGKLVENSLLDGEKAELDLKLTTQKDSLYFLSEIRNGIPNLIKSAVKINDTIRLTIENFDKTYIALKYGAIVGFNDNLSDGSIVSSNETDIETDITINNNLNTDNNVSVETPSNEMLGNDNTNKSENKSNKKWVVVQTEDPLQWFWDTYDTFAANIWMLVMCIITIVLLIASIVFGIILYRKRRI